MIVKKIIQKKNFALVESFKDLMKDPNPMNLLIYDKNLADLKTWIQLRDESLKIEREISNNLEYFRKVGDKLVELGIATSHILGDEINE